MDSKPRSAKRNGWAVALLGVPLLLVGYVASAAPLTILANTQFGTDRRIQVNRILNAVYAPLDWVLNRSPALADAYLRYQDWWGQLLKK